MTEKRQFHKFIIITIIVPSAHDSVIRRENALGVPVRSPSSSSCCPADLHVLNGFVTVRASYSISQLCLKSESRRLAQSAKRESKVVHVLIPFEVPGRDRLWPLAAPGDNTRPMRHTLARKLP